MKNTILLLSIMRQQYKNNKLEDIIEYTLINNNYNYPKLHLFNYSFIYLIN